MRAVIDPNVIISGVLSADGAPAQVLKAWRAGKFEAVVSAQLLAELGRALAYPKLRARITEAEQLMGWISEAALNVDDPKPHPTVHSVDSGDDYLIALAAAHNAALVSGDQHLLQLSGKIPVYTAAAFVRLIEEQS